MGFRLLPKSVTLNDLERRNGRIVCVQMPVLNLVLCLVLYTCFAFYCISAVLCDRCWFCQRSDCNSTVINEHNYYYYPPLVACIFRYEFRSKLNKQPSYRRETALQSGLVMAKSGRLELRDNIYGQYRSIFNHCDVYGLQRNRNRRKKNAK